jgi:polyisoprenoid-binding protein YceI
MTRTIIAVALSCAASAAHASTYKVGPGSQVSFLAHITGTTFTAINNVVSGSVITDENGVVTEGTIVLDAKEFDTGISMRNQHMREKYLETQKCPNVTLDLKGAKLPQGGAGSADVDGTMEAHCVKKPVKLHVTVTKSGDVLEANSSFPINVTDYGIPQPKFAVVTMQPVVEVTTLIRFSQAP